MTDTLTKLRAGKVRDLYEVGDDRLLLVASDRLSAFDVVLAEPIPDRGRVLTALTVFWLERMADVVPNHLISVDVTDFPPGASSIPDLEGRTMLVRRAEMLQMECIVRGYLSGSGWKEYRQQGTVGGHQLPAGLQESARFDEPLFTPSTKADEGHDENLTPDQAVELVGQDLYDRARHISLTVYNRAAEWAEARGIIVADTKFELGFLDGELALCDEVLTPDSSRFWAIDEYRVGSAPPPLDKQLVRDWLEQTDWDKTPPPPALPDELVQATRQRYVTAYERLTGASFDDWPGVTTS